MSVECTVCAGVERYSRIPTVMTCVPVSAAVKQAACGAAMRGPKAPGPSASWENERSVKRLCYTILLINSHSYSCRVFTRATLSLTRHRSAVCSKLR